MDDMGALMLEAESSLLTGPPRHKRTTLRPEALGPGSLFPPIHPDSGAAGASHGGGAVPPLGPGPPVVGLPSVPVPATGPGACIAFWLSS